MFADCCLFSGVYVERAEAAFWFLSLFLVEPVGSRECPWILLSLSPKQTLGLPACATKPDLYIGSGDLPQLHTEWVTNIID